MRCKAHNGGGKTPQWSNEKLTVSVTDHETVEVLCYDDDVGGAFVVRTKPSEERSDEDMCCSSDETLRTF